MKTNSKHVFCRCFSILKSIEFSNSEETGEKAKSLEMLLLEKNKVLQGENTQLKVSTNELNGKWCFITV